MPIAFLTASLGAGAASALLAASLLTGSFGAFIFAYLAPLPLLAVGLWMGASAAAIAGASATFALAALSGGLAFAIVFALTNAAPAFLVARQALLNRMDGQGGIQWYPLGHLIAWVGGIAAIGVTLAGFAMISADGGVDGYASSAIQPILSQLLPPGASAEQAQAASRMITRVLPGLFAVSWFLMIAVNGALAQGVLQRFGLNRRPTPDLATIELPAWIPGATVIAAIGALMPGIAGFLGTNLLLVAAVTCAFLGLAVVHALVRRWNHSVLWLTALYILMFVFGWPAFLLALIGMVEPWLKLRARIAAPPLS